MTTLYEGAFAKLNLTLDVLGKREDGYHDLKSVMQTISIRDDIEIDIGTGKPWKLSCDKEGIPCDERNLAWKAAKVYCEALNYDPDGLEIRITTRIPSEAGLGGGSSDAAAVLRALNRLYDNVFATDELCKIGARIGADVPFCVVGGTMLAEGIGEILSPFPSLPECHIVISGGVGKVSTPEAYRLIDNTLPSANGDIEALRKAIESGDLKEIGKHLYNRFEDTLPSCQEVKNCFAENGAIGTLMSGSGSAVFGIFETEEDAKTAQNGIINAGYSAFLA